MLRVEYVSDAMAEKKIVYSSRFVRVSRKEVMPENKNRSYDRKLTAVHEEFWISAASIPSIGSVEYRCVPLCAAHFLSNTT